MASWRVPDVFELITPQYPLVVSGTVVKLRPYPDGKKIFGDIEHAGSYLQFEVSNTTELVEGTEITLAGVLNFKKSAQGGRLTLSGSIIDESVDLSSCYSPIYEPSMRLPLTSWLRQSLSRGTPKIAVLCSDTAEGDIEAEFANAASTNAVMLHFRKVPFQNVERFCEDVRNAYDTRRPDALVVARGGGDAQRIATVSDNYEAVRVLRSFGLPVFTAIGHAKNMILMDKYADDAFATPTVFATRLAQGSKIDVEPKYSGAVSANDPVRQAAPANRWSAAVWVPWLLLSLLVSVLIYDIYF